ncbi:MAG: glycogen/starch synthase [Anaerolineales bacterium]
MTEELRVLFLISEIDPFIKIGGLGDVGGSLPRALASLPPENTNRHRIDIRICVPLHAPIRHKLPTEKIVAEFPLENRYGKVFATAFEAELNGIVTYLIDGEPVRQAPKVYNEDEILDGEKYVFYSLASLELMRFLNWKPHIVHCHDWHTAPAIYQLSRNRVNDVFFSDTRSILTIHNLPFMGNGASQAMTNYGLPPTSSTALPEWARHLPLPLGLLTADWITTVSPTYATEILTPEFGCGLEEFLASRRLTISGILNGLDIASWDPQKDKALISPFSVDSVHKRTINKQALLEEFSLKNDLDIPLLAFIGRMDAQKGVDILLEGLEMIADTNWLAILLGTGNAQLERATIEMQQKYPNHVRAAIRFDPKLSRMLYGGADMLLIPSRYEPCGMVQMIAMRYGCIPVAHATGGLKDTIRNDPADQKTGFLFPKDTAEELTQSLKQAFSYYRNQNLWRTIQQNAMRQDFSWERSANEYAKLYLRLKENTE